MNDKFRETILHKTYNAIQTRKFSDGLPHDEYILKYEVWFKLFKKELASLTPDEISNLWEYLRENLQSIQNSTATDLKKDYFPLRQRAMKYVREAKEIVESTNPKVKLPWTKVRIVKFTHDKHAGYGSNNHIQVAEWFDTKNDKLLRQLVWHELGHAWFKLPHKENCPLMCPMLNDMGTVADMKKVLKQVALTK